MKMLLKSLLMLMVSSSLLAGNLPQLSLEKSTSNNDMEVVFNGSGVVGLQFDIELPAGKNRVDLSNCLSGIKEAFPTSTCTLMRDNVVRVLIFSMTNKEIPAGMIGSFSGLPDGKITNVVMSDRNARDIDFSVK